MTRLIFLKTAGAALLIGLYLPQALAGEPSDPAGRWAYRSGGRTLLLLELREDRRAPGGWSGTLVRPFRADLSGGSLGAGRGPVVRRSVRATARLADGIRLAARGQRSGDLDLYIFRVEGGTGRLSFYNVAMEPLVLQPARPGEQVELGAVRK